jgi:chorismate lyase/3-hydroxybenzoate synthase
LALIGFGASPPALTDPRIAWVPLEMAGGSAPVLEAWYGAAPAASTTGDGLATTHDGTLLFGHLHLDEAEAGGLEAATRTAYERIFAGLQRLGYPHLLRIWHYFPDIGGGTSSSSGELDRYQVFCRGRFSALAQALSEFEPALPAASALGSRRPGLAMQFLAARQPGVQIENPRQISAFRYPPQYGPRSPSFSRSMLLPGGEAAEPLLISGTASIVGHRSRHADDETAQLAETIGNVNVLLAAAAAKRNRPFRVAALRAYLRRPEGADAVRAAIARQYGANVPMLLLAADICRRDLLLEIEAVACAAEG